MTVLWTLFLFAAQAEGVQQLIDRLSSDRVEVREEACRKLEEAGETALAALRRAAEEGDEETAARAKELLARIPLRSAATDNLIRAVPGVIDRMVKGEPAEIFLEIAADFRAPGAQRRYPALRPQDLERLAPLALRGAAREGPRPDRRIQVCEEIARLGLRTAFAEAVDLLGCDDDAVLSAAVRLLQRLDAKEAVPRMAAAAAHSKRPGQRLAVATVLGAVRSPEAIPLLRDLLTDADPRVRMTAAVALRENDAREAGADLIRLLDDPDALVRSVAAHAAGRLEVRAAVPALARLLGDPSANVRWWAGRSLAALDPSRAAAELGDAVAGLARVSAAGPERRVARGGLFP